jgi:DNA-binding beta-propeller fold protein YncE
VRRTVALAAAVTLALTGLATAAPAAGPRVRQVMFVGNNWDGTATVVDARSYQVVRTLDIVPDLDEELADIRLSPDRLAYYYLIQQGVGEGHDQYVDDMFSTPDGRYLAVARPSLSDVAWFELATGTIVAEAQMAGYRTDHMAVSPDGRRLLVSDSTTKTVNEYPLTPVRTDRANPVAVTPLRTFASGETPHESNYTKDGSRVFHASIGRVYAPGNLRGLGSVDQALGPVVEPVDDAVKSDRWFQVVDTKTFTTVQRWDMGKELAEVGYPHMNPAVRPMAIAPDERFVYLQLSFFHGYVEFDTQAPDLDGTRYSFSDGSLESTRGRVTRVVPLPRLTTLREDQYVLNSAHHGLAIDEAGKTLCVAGTMDDYVALVDRRTSRHTLFRGPAKTLKNGDGSPRGYLKPYWAGDGYGDTCWVSMSGSDLVVVLDPKRRRVLAEIPVGDPTDRLGQELGHPQRVRPGVIAR